MNIAIILAGGTGKRVGAGVPKQFIEVMGRPVIAYTIEKYQNNANIDAIELVCIGSYIDKCKEMAELYGFDKLRWYVEGGATFQESTINGIMALKDKIGSEDTVLITFSVSPMVSDEIIDDAIRICALRGNAIPSDEIIMCTGIKDDEFSTTQNIFRETLVGFNGPQAFRYGELLEAYETAIAEGYADKIDPHTTSLYLYQGRRLWFSKSATTNIKITRPEDLDLFEGSLLLQQKRNSQNK